MKSETCALLEATQIRLRERNSFSEKRKEARYPANDPVEVRIVPEGQPIQATIIDVSRSGVRLELGTSLEKHLRIEILMPGKLAIFGEVRYCRRSSEVFHVGVQIEEVISAGPDPGDHLPEDEIVLYVAGKGLSTVETRRVEDHLSKCLSCSRFKAQTAKSLYPPTRRPSTRHDACP